MAGRLPPLEPPYPAGVGDMLRRLMGGQDVAPLALFRTIAHHPALLDRFRQTGSTLLSFGLLDAVDRETLIHRTTARCGAEYEWGVHAVAFAAALGLDAGWLAATVHGGAAADADLLALADALHDTGRVDDALFARLSGRFDDAQLVEAVCVCGFYHLVSFLCGAFAIEPEPWAARFPGPAEQP